MRTVALIALTGVLTNGALPTVAEEFAQPYVPLVRAAVNDDESPFRAGGEVRRLDEGTFSLSAQPPWRWITVGKDGQPLKELEGLRSFTLCGWVGPSSLKVGSGGNRIVFNGGLIVHLGCGDGTQSIALHGNDRCLVHGLDTDAGNVAKARHYVCSKGLYGRVSVAEFDGRRLPYVDNLVNLLVADELGDVPMAEVMRVLAPYGVALIDGKKTVKPYPPEMDPWGQYLHGADNNAVAKDALVGPPRHLQWVDAPGWSRSHVGIPSVVSMVTAKGRLFTIEDRATREHPFLPGRFKLIARDAFNGLVLWTRDFADWEPITRYVKDIAMQSQRRLAAIGEAVYCTPGLNAPIVALDAATGKVLKTYAGTERTQEFACDQGILYAVIGDRMNAARYNIVKAIPGKGTSLGGWDPQAPFDGAGFRRAYAPESHDKPDPVCSIVAIDAVSGAELWRESDLHGYIGCTLAVKGKYAVYQTSTGMVCLNSRTGEPNWRVEKRIESRDGTEANVLILSDTMVFAQEGRELLAYSIENGAERWKAGIARNYEKAADLFLAAGSIWTGGAKQPTSYDPLTGTKRATLLQRMTGPMGHDRCYRNFITEKYYINSKTGGADFLDLATGAELPNHWTRGTCGMGVLPSNGLLYVPPYSCQCSIGAMIKDFNAMYTEKGLESSDQQIAVERTVRLLKGPAYGKVQAVKTSVEAGDWPTYRHDGTRGGATPSRVSAELKPVWQAKLSTTPSPPVIAQNRVLVSDVHAHAVHALDALTGETIWQHHAGGRIDSPPTGYSGLVLFGSRDGWVHCLRAVDGELVWRFKDLPDKLIGAFGQLESAWPVGGSLLVINDTVYFAAGRSSFLDGGIFLYALDPYTGLVKRSRRIYGPFDADSGFPAVDNQGSKADVLVTDGELLYMRHKAFHLDLSDASAGKPHVIPSAGFLDGSPQHRTYWTVAAGFTGKTTVRGAQGDILVTSGNRIYEMRGFPVHRHSYFDPRLGGYRLCAMVRQSPAETAAQETYRNTRRGKRKIAGKARPGPAMAWSCSVPLTGKAMVMAGDVLFIAGNPVHFAPEHPVEKYEAAYEGKLGGTLWAASAEDGKPLAHYRLASAPVWDGMAAAGGRLYVSLQDGTVVCFAAQ